MNKLKLPNSWRDISIQQFNEIKEIDDSNTAFMKQILLISILADIDPTDALIEEMDIVELIEILSKLTYLMEFPSTKIQPEINNFKLIDLINLKLGEFIDIDYFISENAIKNLSKIVAILYRNYKYDEFNNIIYEQYDSIDFNSRTAYFESISIDDTFGIINHFLSFKTTIYTNYEKIFNPVIKDEDLDPEDLEDPITQLEIEKEKSQQKWSWEFVLHNLSKGDVTKYNDILNLPLIFVLNQLTFKKGFALV